MPIQVQGVRRLKVSRPLINEAYKVHNPNGRVAPEVREAVREGFVTVSNAVKDNVSNVSHSVQRDAFTLDKDDISRTISSAVEKVGKERPDREDEPVPKFDPPTRFWGKASFHCCSVDALKNRTKPGTVDLVLANPPESVRLGFFSKIAELADHVLSEAGLLLVVVLAVGSLREMLDRLSRGAKRAEFIAEFSVLFPAPFTDLGDPHCTQIRRAALMVFGKHGAKLPKGDDVIKVPAPAGGTAPDGYMEIKDGLPLFVSQFTSQGRTVCIPTLANNRGAVVAALAADCIVIGADEEQSVIDDIMRELS